MNLSFAARPKTFSNFIGQSHLLGRGKLLNRLLKQESLPSLILWGPPGCGKTTLAYLLANYFQADFHQLSAVTGGKADLKVIIDRAQKNQSRKLATILFIDEIHRWNKAQQDALLPFVESGLITLIGSTTENPSFEIINPLLSRCRLLTLTALTDSELKTLLQKTLASPELGLQKYKKSLNSQAESLLVQLSGGDARVLLNALEIAVYGFKEKEVTVEVIQTIFQSRTAGLYDKAGNQHYYLISALIKSMRGSDVDAALYYLVRMLEAGEDPKFIARRMIIFCSEDIGLADRGALIQANAGFEAVHKVGLPEAKLILSHIVIYLCKAKKSRAVANALQKTQAAVYQHPNEPVPLHLRNPITKLDQKLGYGQNYQWSQTQVGPKGNLSFLPERLKNARFYKE